MNTPLSRYRRRWLLLSNLTILLPIVVIGSVWALIITGDMKTVFVALMFLCAITFMHLLLKNFNRLLFYFTRKQLSFGSLQIISLVTEVLTLFILIVSMTFISDGRIQFSKENSAFYLLILFISFIVGILIRLLILLNRMVGQRLVIRYNSGRYHVPREEEFIFLFLDLQDSTALAEIMGQRQFFAFINAWLHDMADPIIYNKAEIYKYVGDEVIIIWTMKRGLKKQRCLRLFFDIKDQIMAKQDEYLKQFGHLPVFKAGLHAGSVVVGEMGDIRSEIAYMGDTVNTAARLKAKCRKYQAEVLISAYLVGRLIDTHGFKFHELENLKLKGKKQEIQVMKVIRSKDKEIMSKDMANQK